MSGSVLGKIIDHYGYIFVIFGNIVMPFSYMVTDLFKLQIMLSISLSWILCLDNKFQCKYDKSRFPLYHQELP